MDLSVLIPARNEEWVNRTVADVLEHAKGDTEVIVVLDGVWPAEPLPQHPRLQVIFVPQSIGQRAATNLAARISTAKYVMKLDAHCSVADGFDVELIKAAEELGPKVTQIPAQYNLKIYDRVCQACGRRNHHGPKDKPCDKCGGACDIDVVWKPRKGTLTTNWTFTPEPKFQYGGTEQHWDNDIADVMTSLGACFFMERDFYLHIGGLDEDHGSWGSFGIEIACKTWLSGGRHVTNRRTSFSHFFRVGGIGFPYTISGTEQDYARKYSRNLWFGNNWPMQDRPLRWLVDKFWPIANWTEADRDALPKELHGRNRQADGTVTADRPGDEVRRDDVGGTCSGGSGGRPEADPAPSLGADVGVERSQVAAPAVKTTRTAGVLYYSDCRPDAALLDACRRQLRHAVGERPIVSVTLKPVDLGHNIVFPRERGYLTMAKQILIGLETLDTDYVFHAEHDLLYQPSHFDFEPERADVYYYNQNVWKVDAKTGKALFYYCNQLSGLCADRKLLVQHFRRRVDRLEASGYSANIGFEPGTHRRAERIDDYGHATWMSAFPNIDIRHDKNLTRSRWSQDQFRNQRFCQGWQESHMVPGWGITRGRFDAFLSESVA